MRDPTDRLAPIVRFAPAKLNLTLAVVGRRPDGLHTLHSVMAALTVGDRLSAAAIPAAAGETTTDTLHVEGLDPGPPGENLVLRAIALAREAVRPTWPAAPAVPPPLALRLEKRIPIAAGLAGGSSDAAAALDAALEAWGADVSDTERAAIAARLGSDVPFFLTGGLALVEGRGEQVTPLPDLRGGSPAILVVTPGFGVSTADVFAAFAAGARSGDQPAVLRTSLHFADELAAGALGVPTLVDRAGVIATANDLVAATALVAPAVPRLRRALARLLGRRVGQSGSGPTVWALYPSLVEGRAAAALVDEAFLDGRLEAGHGRPFVALAELLPRSMPGRPETENEERRG